MISWTAQQRTWTATQPLVDYSDDDSDDESDAMGIEDDHETREEHVSSAKDHAIPGMAVFSRKSIECNTTVVKIPPRAVLSYPNVFGTSLTDHAGRQRVPQWGIDAADPATITGSPLQRSELRYPSDTASERSGANATSPTSADWLSLVNTASTDIDESSAAASLALSLALLNELAKEEASRWWGYLQSLPADEPSLAIFWDESDLTFDILDVFNIFDAGREHARSDLHRQARRLITGTQLDRYLKSPAIRNQMIAIRTFFAQVADPFLRAQEQRKQQAYHQKEVSRWALFRRAYTLVSSRAFWVDAYHGLALVPVADAFNHTEEHHVHLETDWEVCRICGALNSCPHDGDEPDLVEQGGEFSSTSSVDLIQHSFDMVSDRAIDGEFEVFNTYSVEPRSQGVVGVSGEISNVELMCRYGFVLEGNGADRLLFDEEEIRQVLVNHVPGETPFEDVGDERNGKGIMISEIRALFVDTGLLETSDVDGLEMDAEGSISSGLYTLLSKRVLSHTRSNGEDDDEAVAKGLVQGVCACVVGLCEGRIRAMIREEEDDDEEKERRREGLLTVVGRYMRGERALLKAAVQLWRTFGDSDVIGISERLWNN